MEIQTAFADVKDELDSTFFSSPRAKVLRPMCVSHLIHHRAQLDVPVPATYGPTADDDGGFGG